MKKECHIDTDKVGLSEHGKTPCELCALIESLREVVSETARQVKQLEPVKAYEHMKVEFARLNKLHKKCAGCGLCFGGSHIAYPVKNVNGVGLVCQWCNKEIGEIGLEKYKALLKREKSDV